MLARQHLVRRRQGLQAHRTLQHELQRLHRRHLRRPRGLRGHGGGGGVGSDRGRRVVTRGSQKYQLRQYLGFCTADFWSWFVYKSAVQKHKLCLT